MEEGYIVMDQTTSVYSLYNATVTDVYNMSANANIMSNITNVTSNFTETLTTDMSHVTIRILIYDYLGPITCMFGMISNIINLVVLTQNELPESPYTHLTGLACTDFTSLFVSFIYMMFSSTSTSYAWKLFDCYIFIGVVNICVTSSVMITVQLTIERFLFVRFPFWAKDTCDRSSAKWKILLTVAGCAIFNIPRFLCFTPVEKDGKYYASSTDFRKSDLFYGINWVYGICVHFVPLFILSSTNIYLVYAVHRAGQQREKFNIRNNKEAIWQKEQRRLTITLISIVFLFIVCIIPSAFCDRPIAYAIFGGSQTEKEFVASSFYFSLQYISNYLVWFELSLNFVLYCAFNEKFRRVMMYTAKRLTNRIIRLSVICGHKPDVSLDVQFRKYGQSLTRTSTANTNLIQNSRYSMTMAEDQTLPKPPLEERDLENVKEPLMNNTAI